MTLSEAIRIISYYQFWRKGGGVPMATPKEISEAIDALLLVAKKEQSSNRKVLVTPDLYLGSKKGYRLPMIKCPKCSITIPAKEINFCSNCGVPLKLSFTVQKYVKTDW